MLIEQTPLGWDPQFPMIAARSLGSLDLRQIAQAAVVELESVKHLLDKRRKGVSRNQDRCAGIICLYAYRRRASSNISFDYLHGSES
jgi:hypothetical protein